MPTTSQTVIEIVRDISPTAQVDEDNTATELFELGLDSLDHASVLLQIEERFDIKFSDSESDELVTVDAIVDRLESQIASAKH